MIKNEKQYVITKKKLKDFQSALELIKVSEDNINDLSFKLKTNSINSQIEVLKNELLEYETLKKGIKSISTRNIDSITTGIIKARIAKGYNHKKMAEILGTSEQQIQKYESEDYLNISIKKFQQIITALDINVFSIFNLENKKNTFLTPKNINVEDIQNKIRTRGTTVKMCHF